MTIGGYWFRPGLTGRTVADDLRDRPRPVDATPHVHFHHHGGKRHAHQHVHPDDHAHSTRWNISHEEQP